MEKTMATTIAQLMATLGLDSTEFKKGLGEADEAGGKFSSTMSKLSMVGGGIVAAGLGTVTAGAAILGRELYNDIQIAADSQKVQSQLQAVLKSTGGVAGMTAEEVEGLSSSLSSMTTFDDEAITSGQSMLLTFTNIGENVFPRATETMLDMSQALGQDLQSSAIQLGKALNDPVQGITALQRVGVSFSDEQKKMVEQMVKSGDVMGAQTFILDELQKEFGGSAKAAGQTFAGQMTILKNQIDNVRESVGVRLIPIISKLIKYFVNLYNKPEVQEFLNKAVDSIVNFVDYVVSNVPKAFQWFKMGFDWLAANKPVVIGILAALGVAVIAFGITVVSSLLSIIIAALPIIAVMALIGIAAYLLYRAWTENWGGIQEKFAAFVAWLKQTWDTLWAALLPIFQYFMAQFKSLQEAFRAALAGDWETVGAKLREIWDRAWAVVVSIATTAWNNLRTGIANLIKDVITKFKTTDWASVGKNLLMGIIEGALSLRSWMISKLTGIANDIVSFFKGFFGIHSRSQLMYDVIGKNLALGVNGGFADNLALSPVSVMGEVQAVSSSAFSGTGSNNADVLEVLKKLIDKPGLDEFKLANLFATELQKVVR